MRTFTLFGLLVTSFASSLDLAARQETFIWQPEVGTKWQIILSRVLDISKSIAPANAPVWDLDLANTPPNTITSLKSQGHKVICYFSAGTAEQFRKDINLPSDVFGATLPLWPNERWLDIRRDEVFGLAKTRIELAARNGCDAIDPDNLDVYDNENGGGFATPLTKADSIAFLKKLAVEARQNGMAIGLKNSQAIMSDVADDVQFAVNEECVKYGGCEKYDAFLASGKPVFQIEYDSPTPENLKKYCTPGPKFSLVLKPEYEIDGRAYYCDGSHAETATFPAPDQVGRHGH